MQFNFFRASRRFNFLGPITDRCSGSVGLFNDFLSLLEIISACQSSSSVLFCAIVMIDVLFAKYDHKLCTN